jgi:anti-sigma factor RsiW
MMHHDKERLIAYLYDECEPAEREAARVHLANCAECRTELEALRAVRIDLTEWAPPERTPGFRLVADPAPARRLAFWPLPAWGLAAAAAVLVLAAASAIANVEVRYSGDGFTVRTGWGRAEAAPSAPAAVGFTAADRDALQRELAALQQQVHALQQAPTVTTPAAVPAPAADADLVRRFRALIEQSEKRQQTELALRIAQLWRDVDNAHRTDLARLQHGFGELQNTTTQLNRAFSSYVIRTSQQR